MAADDNESTIDDRYSVTIPRSVRENLALRPGDRLEWHVDDGRIVARAVDERSGAESNSERPTSGDERAESAGVGVDLDPIDMGETDAVEATDAYDWS